MTSSPPNGRFSTSKSLITGGLPAERLSSTASRNASGAASARSANCSQIEAHLRLSAPCPMSSITICSAAIGTGPASSEAGRIRHRSKEHKALGKPTAQSVRMPEFLSMQTCEPSLVRIKAQCRIGLPEDVNDDFLISVEVDISHELRQQRPCVQRRHKRPGIAELPHRRIRLIFPSGQEATYTCVIGTGQGRKCRTIRLARFTPGTGQKNGYQFSRMFGCGPLRRLRHSGSGVEAAVNREASARFFGPDRCFFLVFWVIQLAQPGLGRGESLTLLVDCSAGPACCVLNSSWPRKASFTAAMNSARPSREAQGRHVPRRQCSG